LYRDSDFIGLDIFDQALIPWLQSPQEPISSGSISLGSLDRETPTHSSSITEASGLLLWGYPRILALLLPSRCLLLMFIDATLCLFIFNPHLGHSKTYPSWVSTAYQHLGYSLDVFLGSTEAVNATLTLFYVCLSRVF
jgi:hypothetical protein